MIGTFNNKNLNNFYFFNNSKIIVTGLDEKNSNELIKNLNLLKIDNLLSLKRFEIEKIIESFDIIEDYSVFIKYPSSIVVEAKPAKYIALTNRNGEFFFIASNGKLIKTKKNQTDIPYIFGNFDFDHFLILKENIDKSNLDYSDIKNLFFFPSGRWDIELKSGILIKLPQEKIKENLDLCLEIISVENFINLKVIDARQKNQIIVDG